MRGCICPLSRCAGWVSETREIDGRRRDWRWLAPCPEGGGGEVPGDIQFCCERVRDRVDRDQDADSFSGKPNRKKKRCEHDKGAARNSGRREGEEDGGKSDRRQLARVQRNAIEPADEKR